MKMDFEVCPLKKNIGSDIQFLFADDVLENNALPYPRHSKQYRNMYKMKQEMQQERIGGFRDFIADVKDGGFPAAEHVIKAKRSLIEDFLKEVG